jgi:hypothetical protein
VSNKSFANRAARLLQELATEQTGRKQSYQACLRIVRDNEASRVDGETRENFVLRMFETNKAAFAKHYISIGD